MLFISWFFMLSFLCLASLWSPAGKGLTSLLLIVMFNCVFVTFPCGIMGQAWYLIISIPDLTSITILDCWIGTILTKMQHSHFIL